MYFRVIIWIELLEEIQALGHDGEASGGNLLEVNWDQHKLIV